jgi:predicted acylesterase/phospholipase RssA
MQFSKLEYIALEGGGGKGAVYKGAIVALEKLFDNAWHEGALLKREGGQLIPAPIPDVQEDKAEVAISILDYANAADKKLKVKGISGSSAGAITAFPLALGLTSKDIGEILTSYPFSKEFLPNHKLNEGKYRMVGMDRDGRARILCAEDHFRKLGEDKLIPYSFVLQEKDSIGRNGLKSIVRSTIISTCFSIIFTGLRENWAPISRLARVVAQFIDNLNYLKKWSAWLKSDVLQQIGSQISGNPALAKLISGIPIPWNAAIKYILKLKYLNRLPWGSKSQVKVLDIFPADNLISALANAIWDRGIYAGFEVRELFFKILLKSISKDTHFKRGLLERSDLLASINVTKMELEGFAISFETNYEVKAADRASQITMIKLASLPDKLTFREFYEITHVNLSICVTNATSNQPVYFSHYFTPDFPVLEALGASMTFPIAFKPIYNEANVLLVGEAAPGNNGDSLESRTFLNPSDFVRFEAHRSGERYFKESFSMREYAKHLAVVLNYIKETRDLAMSVNGNLSFRSFLPYLRKIIETGEFHSFAVKDHVHNKEETYDSHYMKALCYFYYNSAFKGLLIDGGVTNNLPVSIFTLSTDATENVQSLNIKKGVLGLKLDSSFPDVVRQEVFDLLEKDKGGKMLDRLSNWEDKLAHLTFANRIFNNRKMRKAFERNKAFSSIGKEAWIKVSKELVSEYKETKAGFTPWNRQVNALSGLMDSLQFGMDQGQIESIDDNENIIPLYCYGVQTLDFDITSKEMKPLVEMAVEESEKAVMTYFGNN